MLIIIALVIIISQCYLVIGDGSIVKTYIFKVRQFIAVGIIILRIQ